MSDARAARAALGYAFQHAPQAGARAGVAPLIAAVGLFDALTEPLVRVWAQVLSTELSDAPRAGAEVPMELARALVLAIAVSGVPPEHLIAIANVESDGDPMSGARRIADGQRNPALGVYQTKPRYVAAYWPVMQDLVPDAYGSDVRDEARTPWSGSAPPGKLATRFGPTLHDWSSQAIAFGMWWRRRLTRARQVAAATPPGITYQQWQRDGREGRNQALLEQKGDTWQNYPATAINPAAWGAMGTPAAHYNRGSNGSGKWPDPSTPHRGDGSRYERSWRATVNRIAAARHRFGTPVFGAPELPAWTRQGWTATPRGLWAIPRMYRQAPDLDARVATP